MRTRPNGPGRPGARNGRAGRIVLRLGSHPNPRNMDMDMPEQTKPANLLPLVSNVVGAHLENNKISSSELPQLIRDVYQAFARVSTGEVGPKPHGEPAVPIRKSVMPDFVVCLEDGLKWK